MKYCVLKIIKMFTLSNRSTEHTVKVHFMTQGEMTILKIYFSIILCYPNHVLANVECNPGEYTELDTLINNFRAFDIIFHIMCTYSKEKRLAFKFCHRIKISQKQRSIAPLRIWLWHLLWKIKIMEQWKIGFDIYFIFIQGHRFEKPFGLIFILISGQHFGLICTPKSLLFYRIPIKKMNLSLKWTKRCLNSAMDTPTTSSYRMEEITSMQ